VAWGTPHLRKVWVRLGVRLGVWRGVWLGVRLRVRLGVRLGARLGVRLGVRVRVRARARARRKVPAPRRIADQAELRTARVALEESVQVGAQHAAPAWGEGQGEDEGQG